MFSVGNNDGKDAENDFFDTKNLHIGKHFLRVYENRDPTFFVNQGTFRVGAGFCSLKKNRLIGF